MRACVYVHMDMVLTCEHGVHFYVSVPHRCPMVVSVTKLPWCQSLAVEDHTNSAE